MIRPNHSMAALVVASLAAATLACGGGAASSPKPAEPSMNPAVPRAAEPDIVQIGRPVLRARAAEVPSEELGSAKIRELVSKMIDTMRAAPGVGLAAPQIGVPLRVIVLEDRPELQSKLTAEERAERERVSFPVRAFVNPVLRTISSEEAMFFEGCLSVRGYVGMVPRAREVEVSGFDETGAPRTWRVRGWPARILQHEVDHLDGTLYVDRMATRSFANADHARELYAGKPIAEVRRMLGL